jgi:hypothetical protein
MAATCGDGDVSVAAGGFFDVVAEAEHSLSETADTMSATAATVEPADWIRRRHPMAGCIVTAVCDAPSGSGGPGG